MAFVVTPGQLTELGEFYHQLGSLTEAGLGVPQSLNQLGRNPLNARMRAAVTSLSASLGQGCTLTESFLKCGHFAPAFDISLIDAGERSGRLDSVFKLLARYYGDRALLMRQTIGQLAYPLFIAHVAILIFPINYLTGLVLVSGGAARFVVQKMAILVPAYAIAAVVVFACQGRHGERWRALVERLLRFVPLLGTARRQLALARFATALEALISAGVNIVPALPLAGAASGSPALRADVVALVPHIEGGITPAEAFRASTEFPDLFTNLYTSGEVSGKLDETLTRLHLHFQEEGTRKLRSFAVWSGHAVHIAIMLAIAWQVISFYVGYFNQLRDVMK
jgi:type IV pilus assembly protein PilC